MQNKLKRGLYIVFLQHLLACSKRLPVTSAYICKNASLLERHSATDDVLNHATSPKEVKKTHLISGLENLYIQT